MTSSAAILGFDENTKVTVYIREHPDIPTIEINMRGETTNGQYKTNDSVRVHIGGLGRQGLIQLREGLLKATEAIDRQMDHMDE